MERSAWCAQLELSHRLVGFSDKAPERRQILGAQPQAGVIKPDLHRFGVSLYAKGGDVAEVERVQQGTQVVGAELHGGVFPDQMQRPAGAAAEEPVLRPLGEGLEPPALGRMYTPAAHPTTKNAVMSTVCGVTPVFTVVISLPCCESPLQRH